MSAFLTTLPGDIPRLLRRGSPVQRGTTSSLAVKAVVEGVAGAHLYIAGWVHTQSMGSFALDLTDATGRVHAAWWVRTQIRWPADDEEAEMLDRARYADDMTPEQIDALARLVLRLAGRAP